MPERSMTVQQLLGEPYLDSDERFRAKIGDVVLVGIVPSEADKDSSAWSFVTRQGVADLTTDPQQFRKSNVWPLTSRGRLASWFTRAVTIGRAESNDVWIDTAALSKIHARFRIRKEQWELADAGSKNGTQVNGKTLQPNVFEAVKDGDHVNLAGVPCRIYSATKLQRILRFMKPIDSPEDHSSLPRG